MNSEQPISIESVNDLLLVNANTNTSGGLFLNAKESLNCEIDAYNVEQILSSLAFDASIKKRQLFGHLNIVSDQSHCASNIIGLC